MPYDEIVRDGFTCGFGRFFAKGRVERIDGPRLKAMFLPRLTPEANRLLRDHSHFVRGQLQHYGVDYDETQLSGNGTLLLKKVLQAGKVRDPASVCRDLVEVIIADTHSSVRQSTRPYQGTARPDARRVAGKAVRRGAFWPSRVDHGEVLR
jgi:hypothetical protein